MTVSEIDYIRNALERVIASQAQSLEALSELRADVRSYATTQSEHSRRISDLESARSVERERTTLVAADTGRYSITAEMRVAGLEKLHGERIAVAEKATADLASNVRFWGRWSLGQAAIIIIAIIGGLLSIAMK
jgi:hypothetical protein